MNLFATVFFIAASFTLLKVPRRWAAMPLLAGACYMTLGQRIEIGPFNFTVIRLLLLIGFVRVVIKGEWLQGGLTGLDRLLVCWAGWALCSSAFHTDPQATLVNHFGMVYNTLGVYFLIRCFCRDAQDTLVLIKIIAWLLVPVAVEMFSEQVTGQNVFAALGDSAIEPSIRKGRLRSQGPFAHAILAGTVGAVCFPLMMGLWRSHSKIAAVGTAACFAMVLTSASSGPIMSLIFGVFALSMWPYRHLTRSMRIAAVAGYLFLEIVMSAPAYYLVARIDLTGGSTGYHRAKLIESAIQYLDEWWLAGTDYTRHWMPYGVPWSEDHADITNHYLAQGVRGGLALMLFFISIVWWGFRHVGQALRARSEARLDEQFLAWTLGSSLFAHAATCTSVAYFDQSFLFLYLTLGLIVSLKNQTIRKETETHVPPSN